MASSGKRNLPSLFDKDVENNVKRRVNDLPDIDKHVLNLTSEKVNGIINSIIQCMDGFITFADVENKIIPLGHECPPLWCRFVQYEIYYDDENLLKKYYFVLLSLLMNQHFYNIRQNNEIDNINLRLLLGLIINNNILVDFEEIGNDKLNSSSYFSLIGTYLIILTSHRKITTQDICLFSTILQDPIVDKNISNWPVLKDFIELFRSILHIDYVKRIYMDLINDEIGSTKSITDIIFTNMIDQTVEDIFEKRSIGFANLSTCYTAVTCFNRTLIINKNIIILSSVTHAAKLSDNTIMFAGLLITFFYEVFHMLRRTAIRAASSPFYERTPERKVASRGDIYMAEVKMQLENRLLGYIAGTIGYFDGKFLLEYQNWSRHDHDEFKKLLDDMKQHDIQINKMCNRWIIPSKSDNSDNNDTVEENTEENNETAVFDETSSKNRWHLPQCALASPTFNLGIK